ncbi:hypothetical protein PR202_ga05814 [Eleusine coracana subsp. coracana]|uniref:DUF4408 domain-containing protein n=1 Tax=Eleusine coracana subsp. coracana TaxID=191504 RepID=A0AAV5BUH2_ELECO|nr:hypothetical protein QOZ80_5AG0365000 [Eleusine coracana subsp. coracana]GJM89606.1 hypothetical protein PR202_ga05814 [Eleusine coracana subsp. coracana]
MDAAADAMASPLGAWASIRGYFTPATLFLVLNVVIGTIALTSRSRDQRRRRGELHHHDYAHQAMHYQAPPPHDPHQQQQHEYNQYYQQQQPDQYAPLARTSSVLDRLRSIGLYRFRSGDFPPEYGTTTSAANHHDTFPMVDEEETTKQYARSRSEPVPARDAAPPRMKKSGTQVVRKSQQAPRVPATRVVEVVAEDDEAAAVVGARAEAFVSGSRHQREPASPEKAEYLPYHEEEEEEEEEYVPPSAPMRAPPPLSRTSSVLDRLRSLGLYNFLAADQPPAAAVPAPSPDVAFVAAAPAAAKKQPPAQAHYDRSRSEPAARQQAVKKEKKPQPAEAKMAKSSSSSTTRKPAAAGPTLVSQQSVNTRAEAFIDSFRKGQSQPQPQKQPHYHHHHDEDDEEHVVSPPPAPLARTSSVLDRLRSFSLYLRPGDAAVSEDGPVVTKTPAADEKTRQAAAQYARSRSEPARDQGKKKLGAAQAKMSKTTSDVAEEATAPTEECVDARADDFINKFRQQLQLQRLNSLLSYGKQ